MSGAVGGPPWPPRFAYHPDPISTGSVVPSDGTCVVCGRARGFAYAGPVHSLREDLDDRVCPWCIADGTAHEGFGAEFTDPVGVGGYGEWDVVPEAVVEEVAFRTPGFNGWQQERWFTHCGDAAEFLGPMGWEELVSFGPATVAAIAGETGYAGEELGSYMRALDRDRGPTAYLFRCRHCGRLGGYSDTH